MIEAASSSELAKILRRKGYFLVEEKEEGSEKDKKGFWDYFRKIESVFNVPLSEKIFFTSNLEVMIKTGVPLPRAFEILSHQTKNKKFKKVLNEIRSKIEKGENLSSSLGAFPDIFPSVFRETLKVGEETGKLEESLRILAQQMEREHDLKSKITSAMVYPCVVLGLAVIIGILMFIFAIPKMQEAFTELNVKLPLSTRILLSSSDFLIKKWPIAVLIFLAAIFAIFALVKKKKGGRAISWLTLRIPIVSKLVKNINAALTIRTLSSLLSAGVPVVRSLEITSGTLNNFYFKKALRDAALVVEKGKKVSEALKQYSTLYPSMVVEMMEVGEETGETSEVLKKLAVFYEGRVAATTERLSSIIEPMLIIIVGGIVGFFAISMMQPMFSIMKGF